MNCLGLPEMARLMSTRSVKDKLWKFVAMFVLTISTPSAAQQIGTRPLAVLQDNWQVDFPRGVISQDGRLVAHVGKDGQQHGLYVKDLDTGDDNLILKDADGYSEFRDLVFSPDGSRVIFVAAAGVTRYFTSN